ncbi:30S ribosomal protein S1 [Vagococcus sp. BWB3-3]|uniref:30S ribosomal protein S1 n=1 Tax=Vagococcus allomyrinae TaxID=2794353 RepID=A0A940PD68_9ENTE|nr:30S ribosomal protein S1 [Vagococcus allomyrinae]MBP1040613.1 30S ribosomal protein S1 [Vagococcus allomyrinae]
MTEVENNQVENDNAATTMRDALESVQEVKVGDIVQCEVLALEERQAVVSILGTGVEGVVPLKELSTIPTEDINEIVKVGDILDVVVITSIGKDKENGSYLLSKRRLDAREIWAGIEASLENNETIEALVTDVVRGGLVVDVGVRGFVPASMVENHFVSDFNEYKGKTMTVKIIEIEPSENRLILSHKAVLQEEAKKNKEEFLANVKEGEILTGKVARITNFGAFVNLVEGVDGLVHVSEMSHSHIAKPHDIVSVGDEVTVKVLSVSPDEGRVSLSIRALTDGPWDNIEEKAPAGSILTGVIKRLTSFGAFVEIFPGVEGLVHISQISHKHIATPHEMLEEGQTVTVKVLEVHPIDRRLALSIKALEEKEVTPAEVEEEYVMPEESTGFTLGDILGKELESVSETDNDD